MISKSFDQIEKSDISALITNEVRENRMLDYKEKLPGSSDSEKTEFLADVSSFANAAGGYILYGVREKPRRRKQANRGSRSWGLTLLSRQSYRIKHPCVSDSTRA